MTSEQANKVVESIKLSLLTKKPHYSYFYNDCHSSEPEYIGKRYAVGISLSTALFFTLSILFHFNNVCINYTGTLFLISAWMYVGIVVVTVATLFLYCWLVTFCSPEQRVNHFFLTIGMTSCMASVLSWYDVYAYSLNAFAAAAALFMWFLAFIFFIMVFLEGHLRTCPDHHKHLFSYAGRVENLIVGLTVFLGLSWLTYIVLIFFWDSDLYISTPQRNNSTCTPIT